MKNLIKQIGQGMTEYIIIVALIAIAAIGIYSFFGDTITDQMGNMTKELSGGTGAAAVYTGDAAAEDQKGMDDFTGSN
jgi:Flp pilus assembly pilin Flp